MDSPVTTGTDGIKIKPENMEKEKLYHCIFQNKILIVYKDSQEILNCYEIEENEIVEKVKNSGNDDDLEKILEEYIEIHGSETINKTNIENLKVGNQLSEETKKQTDAEEILSEFQNTQISKSDDQSSSLVETEVKTPQEPITEVDISDTVEENSTKSETIDVHKEKHTHNVIFVGTKPILTYVTATLTQLASQPVVTIKARGKRITQAVDVSQMIVKRMNTVGYFVNDVRITSDSLTSQDGKERNVSTIEIDITTK